jgi:hypothetical protein
LTTTTRSSVGGRLVVLGLDHHHQIVGTGRGGGLGQQVVGGQQIEIDRRPHDHTGVDHTGQAGESAL